MATTQIATGAAGMSWMLTQWFVKGKPTLMSVISGAVAGLVAITPAAGYVDCNGAIIMGFLVGIFCSQGVRIKNIFGIDDALDAFGVHGVGGALGSLLTGMFAQPKNNMFYPFNSCPFSGEACRAKGYFVFSPGPNSAWPSGPLVSGAFYDHQLPLEYGIANRKGKQIGLQLYGIVVVAAYSAFSTYIILKIIDKVMGLRVPVEEEVEGLDVSVHGETVFYGSEDLKPPLQLPVRSEEVELEAHNVV